MTFQDRAIAFANQKMDLADTYFKEHPAKAIIGSAILICAISAPLGATGVLLAGAYKYSRRNPKIASAFFLGAIALTARSSNIFVSTHDNEAYFDVLHQIDDCSGKSRGTSKQNYNQYSFWAWPKTQKEYALNGKVVDCQGIPPQETYITVNFSDNLGRNWNVPYHVFPMVPKGYEKANSLWWEQPVLRN
jgi:hypothetical protein